MNRNNLVKSWWGLVGLLLVLSSLPAHTSEPLRLALVPMDEGARRSADLLTVELSRDAGITLLERDQVERIYREQAVGGRDVLKLGQMLGADGLLLLDSDAGDSVSMAGTPSVGIASAGATPAKISALNTRLVAVKPGVVLAAERITIESDQVAEWASVYVRRLQPLLPKLTVLAKDAIPVSVVNLRSAISSPEAPELERQLQTLAVQRLSREPQLFVLERQKLQQVGEEKVLLTDETAFWNGAWLLEGVADQNSYSQRTITLHIKLTPAKGGPAVQFEVGGSRTNLAEVINALAAKVTAGLQINSSVKEWNAADEAAQFYAEAKWALDWGAGQQAQTAADAAWALGKRDLDCAVMRVRTRTSQVPLVLSPGSGAYKFGRRVNFVNIDEPPDVRFCDIAGQALECYAEFCRISPDGEPKVLTRGPGWNDWHNSEWYQSGIEALEASSRVLQHFNFSSASQKVAADKLAELRSQARSVAELIFKAPSVHGSYFVGNRVANHDELAHTMDESANIFSCMLNWGCFWQERPEHTLELYRRLMASPVFCYIHDEFWKRDAFRPRLVAWNDEDRKRISQVWKVFSDELNASTNLLWRMEAKALTAWETKDKALAERARQEWWSLVRSNRAELVGNNVELFYLGWRFESSAETEAMNREYWDKTIPAVKATAAFEEQKQFLRENQPYEFLQFAKTFREKSYSQQQALELLPLIDAYKSNLLAQAQEAERSQKFRLEANARSVDVHLRRQVEAIAHPQTQPPSQPVARQVTQPVIAATPKPARPTKQLESQEAMVDTTTNIMLVQKFLEIPLEGRDKDSLTSGGIAAHHLVADKLLLDLELERVIRSSDAQGNWRSMRYATISTIAILDTKTERWQVLEGEETETVQRNPYYHHTTLWHGSVFTSQNGKVRRYDLAKRAWADLELPDVGNCALFVVNDRLYGATHNLIVEILENGASLRILASNRRQPPASALDRETLSANGFVRGTPALFGDPGGKLQVIAARKVFSWSGTDWSEVCILPQAPGVPQISEDGVLLIGDGWNMGAGVWRLPAGGSKVDYCLGPERNTSWQPVNARSALQPKALWQLSQEHMSALQTVTSRGGDLLLLRDHAKAENIVNEKEHVIIATKILPQDGYHASVLCFSSNYAIPQKLYLRFDEMGAAPPVSGQAPSRARVSGTLEPWLCVGNTNLYLGCESFFRPSAGSSRVGNPPKIGVWVVALEQLDKELERQRKIQDGWRARVDAENRKAAQRLLENFDRNHDGQIDGEEKEAAFRDENFIASQFDQIDANQNGWLDAAELKYFDANKNNLLDADEQTGIGHAQHLLAAQLLRKADSNGDGLLDRREFDVFGRDAFDPAARAMMGNLFPDDNNDKWIDVEEMRAFCEQQTKRGLQNRRPLGRPFVPQMLLGAAPVRDAGPRFKALVEEFWQNDGTNTTPRPVYPGFVPPTAPLPASGSNFSKVLSN